MECLHLLFMKIKKFIGTDYFGEKPIYYLKNDQGFYFAQNQKY